MKGLIQKNGLIFIITLLLVTACSEDFLDKKPLGQLSSDTFFTTEEHAVLGDQCRI